MSDKFDALKSSDDSGEEENGKKRSSEGRKGILGSNKYACR